MARRTALQVLAAAAVCCATGTVALLWFGARGGRTAFEFARWPFIDMWIRWDAGWYYGIATGGYAFSTTEQSAVAYFPLYPGLMRGVALVGLHPFLAGILLTLVFGVAAGVFFRAWVGRWVAGPAADHALWLLCVWPFAYYLYGAVYSDALFLALAIGAFLCLEKGWVWRATLFGALATATRPLGPAVVLGLLARQLEITRRAGKRWSWVDFIPALSGAGLAAYMAFLYARYGDPLAFLSAQAAWHQTPGADWLAKFPDTWRLLTSPQPSDAALRLFHLALCLLIVAASFRAPKRLGWGYTIYLALVLGIPLLSSRDFMSLGRYSLAAFPAFLLMSEWLDARPKRRWAWLAVSVLFLGWMVSRFAIGRYVA